MLRELAAYIMQRRGKRSPEEVSEIAIKRIHGVLRSASDVFQDEAATRAYRQAKKGLPEGNVPVWFSHKPSTVTGAAWANSYAATQLSLDKGETSLHNCLWLVVVPTAIALRHETNATFEDILTAVVIGFEVGNACSTHTTNGTMEAHLSCSAVATAAAMHRASQDEIEHAFGIAIEPKPKGSLLNAQSTSSVLQTSYLKERIPASVIIGLSALDIARCAKGLSHHIHYNANQYRTTRDLNLGPQINMSQSTAFEPKMRIPDLSNIYLIGFCMANDHHNAQDQLDELIVTAI